MLDAPRFHPSATVISPPSTSKTRPVTSRDSSLTNHATNGAMFSGAIASNSPSAGAAIVSANTVSVIRVRAAGAMAFAVTP